MIAETQEIEEGPEIFIGLVNAVGTDMTNVVSAIRVALAQEGIGYSFEEIHLSHLLRSLPRFSHLKADGYEDERIFEHMQAGNNLRSDSRRGDALALLAVAAIRSKRAEKSGDPGKPLPRQAYILNSLKHPDEVETLRKIYGDAFFLISAYEQEGGRIDKLTAVIKKSRRKKMPLMDGKDSEHKKKAEELTAIDEKEENNKFGQNVRETFHKADFFVSCDSSSQEDVKGQVNRFIRLLFGARFITPTIDEYAIFHAHAAALKSADLSRQVGAVIVTDQGELISAGCNEVPSIGGAPYWEGENSKRPDTRDFKTGHDENTTRKNDIVRELIEAFKNSGWLDSEIAKMDITELVSRALKENNGKPAVLKGARITSLIEFGRIVHAEMSAITDAARRGIATKGHTLYCTTYPCHICSRHIIAAGIRRVIFVEPYPKSLTKDLYYELVTDSGSDPSKGLVSFEPFIGVAPRQYFALFKMLNRKDDAGYAEAEEKLDKIPKVRRPYPVHLKEESKYLACLEDLGIIEEGQDSGKLREGEGL